MIIETHVKFPLFGERIQIYVVPEKAPSLNIDMYMKSIARCRVVPGGGHSCFYLNFLRDFSLNEKLK